MKDYDLDRNYLKNLEKYNAGINPGIALVIIQDGNVILESSYGYANLEEKTKITSLSNFRMASISKQFTGMALAILEERKELDVKKPISFYWPHFPKPFQDITIDQLIHHLSGLPDYYMELCAPDIKTPPPLNSDVIQFLRKKSNTNFAPGNQFEYSNTGYNVLGTLIEKISSLSYSDFIQKYIFEPSSMHHSTVIRYPEIPIPDKVVSYSAWPMFELIDDHPGNYMIGEDGIYTSIADISKWINAIEHHTLVSREVQQLLFSPSKTNAGNKVHYGYGWCIEEYFGHRMYLHGGAWLGFSTIIVNLFDQNLWYAAFTNSRGIQAWDVIKPLIHHHLRI